MEPGDDCKTYRDTSTSDGDWALAFERPRPGSTSSLTMSIVMSFNKVALRPAIALLSDVPDLNVSGGTVWVWVRQSPVDLGICSPCCCLNRSRTEV